MRSYCKDSHLVSTGSVVPENSISGRGRLLGIGFEDFFSIRSCEAGEFVGLKAFMPWILR